MNFASDNTGPVAPEIMDALTCANQGYATAYGDDQIMAAVQDRVRDIFEAPDAAVYLVATGTAANSLSLASHISPWQSVFCHRLSHVNVDECGAPEFFTNGAKLVVLGGDDAKIDVQELQQALEAVDGSDPHLVQRGMLTVTQLSERGTVYSLEHLRDLTGLAKSFDMPCHLDGARFTNALVALDVSPAEMTWKSGIDVVSFGGSKNGLMGVEAVILFDPEKAWEFELRRKRAGHLLSKHRYLSAQMQAYLKDDLWLGLAQKANRAGKDLARVIETVPGAQLDHPCDGNMIFASFPRGLHQKAKAAGADYGLTFGQTLDGPSDDLLSCRLVTNWATTQQEIADFGKALSS